MDSSDLIIGGQQIAYRQSSGTGRPVIFVHGNSASSSTWQGVLDGPVGQRYRCLALDLPGHGRSAPAADPDGYTLPGYATLLAGFAAGADAADAVIVGWSLGGHIAIEASAHLPGAAGYVIFGTPPVSGPAQLAEGFLPHPAMNTAFTAEISEADARGFAAASLAPGSAQPLDDMVADILATDGAARAGLAAGIGAGKFADEVGLIRGLTVPVAVLQGEAEQLVNPGYLAQLDTPALWRGAVQVIPGAGHSPHLETPEAFTGLLTAFLGDLG
jgi:pimeloyl-ACP methyl ester carboxylesterase